MTKEVIMQFETDGNEEWNTKRKEELIRCKDCRFNTYSKKCLNPDSFFLVPADDFYCGYAERRSDE